MVFSLNQMMSLSLFYPLKEQADQHSNRSAKKTLYAIRRKKREGLIEYLKRLFNSKKNDGK